MVRVGRAWIKGLGRESKEWKVEYRKWTRSAKNGIFRSLWRVWFDRMIRKSERSQWHQGSWIDAFEDDSHCKDMLNPTAPVNMSILVEVD